jgi:Flp pilus assembly protein TadD
MRTALALTSALCLATLAGCNSGHGKYTNEGKSLANQRVAELKSMNEYNQAKQAYLAGDLDKATKYIDRSLTINPSVAMSHVLRGRILIEQSDLEEACNALLRAEALDPKDPEAEYYLGIVYERFSQPEKALERYTKASELQPANAQYAVAAAETMMDMGKLDEAEKFLNDRSAAFEHNAGVRQTLGHIAMMRGKPEDACKYFDDARLLAPDDSGVVEDLVRAEVATGKWADAEFNISRLLRTPENAARRDLKHMQAKCLLSLDRGVEARQVLLDLTSDDAGQKDVEAWVLLGNTSYMLRDLNRVRMAYTRTIALAPERSEGYMLRALWERKQGELQKGLVSVEKAVERRGTSVEPLLLKGVILREMGRSAESTSTFKTVLAQDPSNQQAKKALGALTQADEH